MRLSKVQTRVLQELAEPNGNPDNEWRGPLKWNRTLEVLRQYGLVKFHGYSAGYGSCGIWSITKSGRDWLTLTQGDENGNQE